MKLCSENPWIRKVPNTQKRITSIVSIILAWLNSSWYNFEYMRHSHENWLKVSVPVLIYLFLLSDPWVHSIFSHHKFNLSSHIRIINSLRFFIAETLTSKIWLFIIQLPPPPLLYPVISQHSEKIKHNTVVLYEAKYCKSS